MSKATVTIVFKNASEQENFKKTLRRVKNSKKIKYSEIVQNAVLEYEQKNCPEGENG
jgi:hypothetical protein